MDEEVVKLQSATSTQKSTEMKSGSDGGKIASKAKTRFSKLQTSDFDSDSSSMASDSNAHAHVTSVVITSSDGESLRALDSYLAPSSPHNRRDTTRGRATSELVLSNGRVQGQGNAYTSMPDEPWSPSVYLTVRGMENILILVWVAKDLSWTTATWPSAWLFGISALSISFWFILRALYDGSWEEIFHGIGQFLWILANFFWMIGELHDDVYPDEPEVYDTNLARCKLTMEIAFGLFCVWYLVVKPLKIFPEPDPSIKMKYDECGLIPSIPYFNNWRQYELFHYVLWLGKDYSWCIQNKALWFIFTPPTLLIAIDFIWTTGRVDNMIIDHAHYCAQLIWVIGNGTWALGELFWTNDDDPEDIFGPARRGGGNARFFASWFLLLSYVPILILYCVWVPLSCMGKIEDIDNIRERSPLGGSMDSLESYNSNDSLDKDNNRDRDGAVAERGIELHSYQTAGGSESESGGGKPMKPMRDLEAATGTVVSNPLLAGVPTPEMKQPLSSTTTGATGRGVQNKSSSASTSGSGSPGGVGAKIDGGYQNQDEPLIDLSIKGSSSSKSSPAPAPTRK